MEFTEEEEKVLDEIIGGDEKEDVRYRSFRIYRTAPLWKELALAACWIVAGGFYYWLSESVHNEFFLIAIIVFVIGSAVVDGVLSGKRKRINDSIIRKYKKEMDRIMDSDRTKA